jgi:hypothetical protein
LHLETLAVQWDQSNLVGQLVLEVRLHQVILADQSGQVILADQSGQVMVIPADLAGRWGLCNRGQSGQAILAGQVIPVVLAHPDRLWSQD